MKQNPDLHKKLNLNYLHYTNCTVTAPSNDLPVLHCKLKGYPDYLALSSEPGCFHKTEHTAVCFYQFDDEIDGQSGLANAIYYNDKKRLNYFKERFSGIKYFIMPDYTVAADVIWIDNANRIFRARLVAIWLTMELNAVVIPNVTTTDMDHLEMFLDGYQDCDAVAISTKGHMDNTNEKEQLREIIRRTVDYLHPPAIIVYDVCGHQSETIQLFDYAAKLGTRIVIPSNSLQAQNIRKVKGGMSDANE